MSITERIDLNVREFSAVQTGALQKELLNKINDLETAITAIHYKIDLDTIPVVTDDEVEAAASADVLTYINNDRLDKGDYYGCWNWNGNLNDDGRPVYFDGSRNLLALHILMVGFSGASAGTRIEHTSGDEPNPLCGRLAHYRIIGD